MLPRGSLRTPANAVWIPAIIALLLAAAAAPIGAAGAAGGFPTMDGDRLVLQNAHCRWEIGVDGQNRAFVDRADGKDRCVPGQAFMLAFRGEKSWPSTRVELAGDGILVSFGDSGIQVRARLEARPRYLTMALEEVTGDGVDKVRFSNLHVDISANVGPLVNAAWDDRFAACLLACNDRTNSFGASNERGQLLAEAYREYGFEGAKVALIGVPTGPPDPASKLLDAIEVVELEQGLPHPMRNGVWIKRSPDRFASYLMVNGITPENVDRVIEFARGGFGCIEIDWWKSTPSYELNPKLFPKGMASFKEVAGKVHRAGLQLGLHAMQAMVGWGSKEDPYITPHADPRLLQERHATLTNALDAGATVIPVEEGTEGWPEKGDLYLEGEIVQYTGRTGKAFTGCKRGLWNTTVAAHPRGAKVGLLTNCFPIWGHTVYCPDVRTTMVDEVCERLAFVFNEVGADMAYFDGGEEIRRQPPHWRNQGRVALGVQRRLKTPVILEGNDCYTHLSWHVITRGSPTYDPIYFGRREYTLRGKGQNPAGWAKNLLTGDVGWFAPHTWGPATDAVTPDEVLLLCLKALGGNAPISFSVYAEHLWANRRMPEMLGIIRACDELKRRGYFTEEARAELVRPRAEHTLEQAANGEWCLRPLQFGPPRVVDATAGAGRPDAPEWACSNPHGEQRPWVRIRARAELAPYGSKENLVLADPAAGVPFQAVDTAAADLVQSVEASPERTPDGAAACLYRAENRGGAVSKWCRASLSLPKPLNLGAHRRIGLWVRSESPGGILNVQLAGTDTRRDHYIALDVPGWRYVVLDPPEDTRFWGYTWPYRWTDLFYTAYAAYNAVKEVNLCFNGLPAGAKASCWVGRIEALHERPQPLRSPALEAGGRRVVFPVSLQPEEYLEMDWQGRCRRFERNGGLLAEVEPEGELRLAAGDNRVRFSCEGGDAASPRAEVTLSLRGEPLANARRPGVKSDAKAARYPSLSAEPLPEDNRVRLAPGDKDAFRMLQGVYQRVVDAPARAIAAYDGTANAWEVRNDGTTPCPAALVLSRAADAVDVNTSDPKALLLEGFEDLGAYRLSETNAYEKYVLGGGKRITPDGPAREGVSHRFSASAEGARAGRSCGVYTAANTGAAGGWCAQGKRFARPLDLSPYQALALWIHGDGKGETLRIQLRDVEGRNADWLVPIRFEGWRLQLLPLAEAKDFDRRRVDYLLLYYNDLPAQTTCTLKLDDLKALPSLGKPRPLRKIEVRVGERRASIPGALAPGESLTVDPSGEVSVWRGGVRRGKPARLRGGPLLLAPGANRVEVWADRPRGAPADLSVRVLPCGEGER